MLEWGQFKVGHQGGNTGSYSEVVAYEPNSLSLDSFKCFDVFLEVRIPTRSVEKSGSDKRDVGLFPELRWAVIEIPMKEVECFLGSPSYQLDVVLPFKARREFNSKIWVVIRLVQFRSHHTVGVLDNLLLLCDTQKGALLWVEGHLPTVRPVNHGVQVCLQ